MRGDPAAFPLPPRTAAAGTPAGEGPLTQEQHLTLRAWGLHLDEVDLYPAFVSAVPGATTGPDFDPHNPPPGIERANCPIVERFWKLITIITPDGRIHQIVP